MTPFGPKLVNQRETDDPFKKNSRALLRVSQSQERENGDEEGGAHAHAAKTQRLRHPDEDPPTHKPRPTWRHKPLQWKTLRQNVDFIDIFICSLSFFNL